MPNDDHGAASHRMMWKWNVHGRSFRDQVSAAVASECDMLAIAYQDYQQHKAAGLTAHNMREIAAENGVRLAILDGLTCWSPVRYPPDPASFIHEGFKAAHDFEPEEAFETCAALGMDSILAAPGFEVPTFTPSELIDHFGVFCEQAAAYGITVHLEPLPMMGLRTLREALEVVAGAGKANGAILFDTWHFMRGDPDFELLKSVPRGMISHVQIGDALPRQPDHSPWQDAVSSRVLPGEGCLPLARIIATLMETQDIESYGLELYSEAVARMSAEEAGKALGSFLDNTLDSARAFRINANA